MKEDPFYYDRPGESDGDRLFKRVFVWAFAALFVGAWIALGRVLWVWLVLR